MQTLLNRLVMPSRAKFGLPRLSWTGVNKVAAVASILSLVLTVTGVFWPGPPRQPYVRPPPDQAIVIETVPQQILEGESGPPTREITGRASASLNSSHVVIYSYTNEWFVQPFEESSFTPLNRDGTWSALIHGGSYYLVLLVRDDFRAPSPSQAPPYALPGVTTWTVVAGVRPWHDELLDVVAKLRWLWVAMTGSFAFVAFLFRRRKSKKEVSA